ncbi:hypothetical protein [Granulicella mallensis]|jgi:hypothetical protein|uniref:Uncharacterized protein n=1 Tax=Granulicella mallensis TaxID=940614 RepID=A0A7W7ZSC0_9BACT|nr:hypothetical protein [Granulicella mallensis]MBB5065244.1 hypothetical protein [Granulicella mallensis]
MKATSNDRKKTIAATSLGAVALGCVIYACIQLFGGSGTPPPAAPPVIVPAGGAHSTSASGSSAQPVVPGGNAPGVAATKLASTSSSLDPTLDQTAMLRTESLEYSGTGRNIFSALYTPPPPPMAVSKFSARPANKGPVLPPPPPPPPPTCPPTCPPINLKFFGTVKHANSLVQAFLLQGEDVYIASQGDIVGRKYKIVSIAANSIQVMDLQNNNTQTLPLQMN